MDFSSAFVLNEDSIPEIVQTHIPYVVMEIASKTGKIYRKLGTDQTQTAKSGEKYMGIRWFTTDGRSFRFSWARSKRDQICLVELWWGDSVDPNVSLDIEGLSLRRLTPLIIDALETKQFPEGVEIRGYIAESQAHLESFKRSPIEHEPESDTVKRVLNQWEVFDADGWFLSMINGKLSPTEESVLIRVLAEVVKQIKLNKKLEVYNIYKMIASTPSWNGLLWFLKVAGSNHPDPVKLFNIYQR
jgi:hypothetical protein